MIEIYKDISSARQMIASYITEHCSIEKTPAEIMMLFSVLLDYDMKLNALADEIPDDFNDIDDADIVNNVQEITKSIQRLIESK
ncbi:MAG: hypothetical protein LUH07_11365 [Lachnospiraceae bacterium]|nr:hypothetical protein [Lachnospiraceae bacterium]